MCSIVSSYDAAVVRPVKCDRDLYNSSAPKPTPAQNKTSKVINKPLLGQQPSATVPSSSLQKQPWDAIMTANTRAHIEHAFEKATSPLLKR